MVNRRSIWTVRKISCNLRLNVFCEERNRFRASCIVNVEDPCARFPDCTSTYAASAARDRLIPQLVSKLLSSIEIIASFRTCGISVYGTTTRRSSANDPISVPLMSSSSVVVFGLYLASSSICGSSIE